MWYVFRNLPLLAFVIVYNLCVNVYNLYGVFIVSPKVCESFQLLICLTFKD
ncbi:hypothetical protein HanPI659440_Chr10g0372881 [Helianthus annuus]|nr:hypothetical protein HanPI659440_Chr10g0372881 [Helianthus annuus]